MRDDIQKKEENAIQEEIVTCINNSYVTDRQTDRQTTS